MRGDRNISNLALATYVLTYMNKVDAEAILSASSWKERTL